MSQAVANVNVTLPTLAENALPTQIPSYFESDFFASAANAGALNAWYQENDGYYLTSLPEK